MKLLNIDYNYCYYPENISSLEELCTYLSENYNSFMQLEVLSTENCVEPYFIGEDSEKTLINIGKIRKIKEIEAYVLSRDEYDKRLKKVIDSVCVNCANFENDDTPNTHREKICLDGKCWGFEKKSD